MHNDDPDVRSRSQRVQGLCQELGALVELSREQRRVIDSLLSQLESLLRSARVNRLVRGKVRSAGSSKG